MATTDDGEKLHDREVGETWDVLERLLGQDTDGDETLTQDAADRDKRKTREEYDVFNRKLNALRFGRYAFFLNYGYVPNENPRFAVVTPPEGHFDLNSRRLVLELIGDCPVNGCDVLDVSCGRGSVATVLRDYFRPRSYLGIDISPEAVAFCRERHRAEHFAFEEGDAESLAMGDACFDVLINIEASHTYPRIEAFFAGVLRVLRPNGWFLYTDLASPDAFERHVRTLCGLGFTMMRDADITANVLLSCDESAERRLKVYRDPAERAFMADFLAAPGSRTYRALAEGLLRYRLFTFCKSSAGSLDT